MLMTRPRNTEPVAVSYESNNNRVVKQFADPILARRFFAAKYRAGKSPKVHAAGVSTMSTENVATVETVAAPVAETPKAKKTPTPKPAAAKKPAKADAKKIPPAPKGKKAEPTVSASNEKIVLENGKVVVPKQVEKEIRWTPAKTSLLAAMKKLGVISSTTARSIEEIAKASNGKLADNQVRHQVNPLFDLSQQEIVKRVKMEDGTKFYLSAKGQKIANK